MCKNPLFGMQRIPKKMSSEGEYFQDFSVPFSKRIRFLKIERAEFDFLKLRNKDPEVNFVEVPCGQCIECRLRKSRMWASRIVCEQMTSDTSSFVTLTYDDEHLPIGKKGVQTLVMDDISKFFKDLRRYCSYHYGLDNVRHYTAGEYGSTTLRPHYHSCIFNLPLELLSLNKPYKVSFNGDIYYNNPVLSKIWRKGFVVLGDLNFQSAAYVARYVVKKYTGKSAKEEYKELCMEPEFARMSRRPGIGSLYYDKYKDKIYEYDAIYLPKIGKVSPSSYFDKKYALDNPEVMDYLKGNRRLSAEFRKQNILSRTDLDYETYLQREGDVLEKRIKKLVRPSI